MQQKIVEFKVKYNMNNNKGIIKTAIIIVVALLIISYMGISVRDVVESPAGQSNFGYIKEITFAVWNQYFKEPVTYLYNDVFLNLIWEPFIEALKDIKNGNPTSIEPSSPEFNR